MKKLTKQPIEFLDLATGAKISLNENPLWPTLHKKGIFEAEKALVSKKISDPKVYTKIEKSVTGASNSDTPTLATVKKYQGEPMAITSVQTLIVQIAEYFNIGKKMNAAQIKMTAELILIEFPYLKIAEIKLCFSFAMRGRYGVLYDRLDGAVICAWLREYSKEKQETAAFESEKKHVETKKIEGNQVWSEDAAAKLKKMLADLREKRKQRKELQKSTFHHASIREFCESCGMDYGKLINPLLDEWRSTYKQLDEPTKRELRESDFIEYMKKRYLAKINLRAQMIQKTQKP